MGKFTSRSTQKEIMDDLEVDGPELVQALSELKTINKLLGGNKVTLSGINQLIKKNPQEDYSIADLGCGRGDMLRVIADWAYQNEIPVALTGIDANPNIIAIAKEKLSDYKNINFRVENVFSDDFLKEPVDIITCTLFTHHFTDAELIQLFSSFKEKVRLGVVINDLHRHPLAYYSIRVLTKYFSRSSMVKNDGPLSVLRSFKKNDWSEILNKAGFSDVEITWKWAFRWKVLALKHR
ncbi:hypothetical protein A33Q_4138 [Indibacter alkaliphilus LW1]|jgi:ubiquinone/menaquinone biosynthesis C-methylase UbiE|uniref:Methyltransferase domain-containing protein n=1 Tax=Indibacter alkaliphilus (strain CCUG 57479 / KCTC 22604 / LW1) TaxID=1189612 RepID=S2D4S9_INDAL|nr:methyltransferase domain-containing protein [Indibacter alkaliphilus]EOZ92045.1 hypothetical protein A33Q_4138 [Indibacter alkaliphilus LW1]